MKKDRDIQTERETFTMERTCRNCRFFEARHFADHMWGYCTRPEGVYIDLKGRRKDRIFTWADKQCSNFEPADDYT